MPNFSGRAAAAASLLCLSACTSVDPKFQNSVILHYQHVANVHQIQFTSPLPLSPNPVNFVMPLDAHGFWAIFVLCALDVTGKDVPSFVYDVNDFKVHYGSQTFGPLHPYTLRLQASPDLNAPRDTPVIADAIAGEVQEGPSTQVFAHGFYPSLNYRFAVYVPKALPNYAGGQLTLRYAGYPSAVFGNGNPPSDIPVVGGSGTGIASRCLP
jgi:hypothetical protein